MSVCRCNLFDSGVWIAVFAYNGCDNITRCVRGKKWLETLVCFRGRREEKKKKLREMV